MLQGLASQADIRTRARLGQGLGGIPRNPSQAIPDENIVFPDRILSGKLPGARNRLSADVQDKTCELPS
jgi:hypothetical protein